jgi:hypothetical protein
MNESHSLIIIRRSVITARSVALLSALALVPVACSDEGPSELDGDVGRGGSAAGAAGVMGGSGGSTGGTGSATGGSAGSTGGATAGSGGSTSGTGGTGGTGGTAGGSGSGGSNEGGAGGNDSGGQGGDSAEDDPGLVFDDSYAPGVGFIAFGESTNNVTIDGSVAHSGSASLKVEVPASGYTGGAFVAAANLDLSAYDAVTFWARASVAHSLNTCGLGDDAAGGFSLRAELGAAALTTEWTKIVIPIPSAAQLSAENGMFHFAEADSEAYTIWLDDIRYETLGTISAPAPLLASVEHELSVGSTYAVTGTTVTYSVDGSERTLDVAPGYFDYDSSDENVATVDGEGVVTGVAEGTTAITAELVGVAATGSVTIDVYQPTSPEQAAPTPTRDEIDVISLFSNAYTNVTVDTWSASWDVADVADSVIETNDLKAYTNLSYAGVEFIANQIDATAMTHVHFDVWLPSATVFKVKLVDFGANAAYGGGDDTDFELTKDALTPQTWQSLDFALADFTGLASREHLAQMVIASSAGATVYFDNVYFYVAE